jgi:hypothetical protein
MGRPVNTTLYNVRQREFMKDVPENTDENWNRICMKQIKSDL